MIVIDKWLGKFTDSICNNLVQLVVCCCIAKEYGHNVIKFPEHNDNHIIFTKNEIVLDQQKKDKSRIISGTYANFDEITSKRIKINDRTIRTCIEHSRTHIYPTLKLKTYENNDMDNLDDVLFIHIRSGDIFTTFIHNCYVQPPYSFYKLIIDSKPWKKIVLLSEDDNNPCIGEIKKNYQITHYKEDIMGTMSIAVNAVNLVIGFGTFGYMMAYLAKNLKHLYLPTYCDRFFPDNNVPFDLHFIAINNYINVGEWNASVEQIELMKNHDMANVSFI